MDQPVQCILDDQCVLYDRTELCARCGISRKTGYTWLARYHADGRRGLQPQRRAPRVSHVDFAAGKSAADRGVPERVRAILRRVSRPPIFGKANQSGNG